MFPNPATDFAIVSFSLGRAGPVSVSIINELGQEIKVLETAEAAVGLFTREIDLRDLMKGIYFVRVDMDNQNLFTRSIVKE